MITLFIGIAVILISALVFMVIAAPCGHQDESGFHLGGPQVTFKEACFHCGKVLRDGSEPTERGICEPCFIEIMTNLHINNHKKTT